MAAQPKVILAADDFSDSGMRALSDALDLAHATSGEVHVVHVVNDQDLDGVEGGTRIEKLDRLFSTLPQRLWERVDTAGKSIAGLHEMQITMHVRLGEPADEIDRTAADYGAAFIVVGTHARKGVERFLLGSVAETLVRRAHCAVFVARASDFSDVTKSERPEPARPGEDLHAQRPELPHHYQSSQIVRFRDVETLGVRM